MPNFFMHGGAISHSPKLKSGSYVSSSINLVAEVRAEHSIRVAIGAVGLLRMNQERVIWTDSLASCFPVVFLFRNGDIELLHSYNSDIDKVFSFLNNEDLFEIQIFEKKQWNQYHENKVNGFVNNLLAHYKNKSAPIINICSLPTTAEGEQAFQMILCYKPSRKNPVICIGHSSVNIETNKKNKGTVIEKDDSVPCNFISLEPEASSEPEMEPSSSPSSSKWTPKLHQPAPKKVEQEDTSRCCVVS